MNYVGSGKPFRRETPHIPSVNEPPPVVKPRLERVVSEELRGRPKLQALIEELKQRGPLSAKEVKALIGSEASNLTRMITGTVVRESYHQLGSTRIRYIFLEGQQDLLEERLASAKSGGGEIPPLRWSIGDDAMVTLNQGSSTIKVGKGDLDVINKLMSVLHDHI